jgi:transposase
MERKAKRFFDKEFKINTVKLIISKEKKISELAREIGVNEATLHVWKKQYLKDSKEAFPGKGHQHPEIEYVRKLERELKVVQEERDILKKALGIFSK